MISDVKLYLSFQREYPKKLINVCSSGEISSYDFDSLILNERFRNRNWESIHSNVLKECYDAVCFLNPEAFQYFFPAFIKQSQVNTEDTSLLVDSILDILAEGEIHWPESLKDIESKLLGKYPEVAMALESISYKDLNEWRKKRLKLFTKKQWEVIREWLNWIDQDDRWVDVDRDVLHKAMKNSRKWVSPNN